MSAIDEIMEQADDFADAERTLGGVLADECDQLRRNMLRLLLEGAVAAALADAVRKGAEAMRESAAVTAWSSGMDQHNKRLGAPHEAREVGSVCAQAIRALPLPTGSQS